MWRGFGATPNILNSASPDFVISLGLIILAHQQILSHNFSHQKLKVWCVAQHCFSHFFLKLPMIKNHFTTNRRTDIRSHKESTLIPKPLLTYLSALKIKLSASFSWGGRREGKIKLETCSWTHNRVSEKQNMYL